MHYLDNRDRQLANTKENNARRRYGLTRKRYDELVAGPCTACGEHEKRRVIDHCHLTGDGHVRGVLCDGCNLALGGVGDNPATLRALADYLESSDA